MITFDFMSDESLRNSLESDYHELEECMKAKAWKAVHVISGSIIEALLLDYLIESEYANRTSTDLRKIDFFKMIDICKSEGVLTNKSAELSHVIREYRNLIHPERVIRIKETVDEESASVARALVRMIIGEVSAKRKQTYGYTSEQIIKKIETDSSVSSILTDLLKNTKENEKKHLLLKAIPQKYFSLSDPDALLENVPTEPESILTILAKCFRYTFEAVSSETKKAIVEDFVKIIKEEGKAKVRMYELVFFRGSDLEYYPPDEMTIVIKHILSTLKDVSVYRNTMENMRGLSRFLGLGGIRALIDIIIKEFINPEYEVEYIRSYLDAEYQSMEEEKRKATIKRLETWKNFYESREVMGNASVVEIMIEYLQLEPLGAIEDAS